MLILKTMSYVYNSRVSSLPDYALYVGWLFPHSSLDYHTNRMGIEAGRLYKAQVDCTMHSVRRFEGSR